MAEKKKIIVISTETHKKLRDYAIARWGRGVGADVTFENILLDLIRRSGEKNEELGARIS